MFGVILYDILFFTIPALLLVLFAVSLYRYVAAKKRNRAAPGTYTDGEMKKRKIILIVSAVAAGVLAAVVLGFMALLFLAVAFM